MKLFARVSFLLKILLKKGAGSKILGLYLDIDSDVIFQTKIQRKGKRRDLDVEEDGPEEEEGSQYVLPFEVLPQGFARSVREEFNRLSQSEEGREQVEFAYERSRRVDKAS